MHCDKVTAIMSNPVARHPMERIAVVGGGITGAVVATELAKHAFKVVLFDQGQRGPGGRASHRSVDPQSHQVLLDNHDDDDDLSRIASGHAYEFDHGCQFFRADSPIMKKIVEDWVQKGWAAPWQARWGRLGNSPKFFGLPSDTLADEQPVFVGVGGMHRIPRQLIASVPEVTLHSGTRISQVNPRADGTWEMMGTCGEAAFHDTPHYNAKSTPQVLATADAVVISDVSASQDSWHRASAGLPRDFVESLALASRPRVPFFSCMVALSEPIRQYLQLDALVADSPLWCAVCSNSKDGFSDDGFECWTLVSTPDFSIAQIQETSMRDRKTGAFRPQENSYLNRVPGPILFESFQKAVEPHLPSGVLVEAQYLQAQRWGSGLPSPIGSCGIINVDGLDYASHIDQLVYARPDVETHDFAADTERGIYYAGDFCSHHNPGFEAAALSGFDLAQHIVQQARTSL